ncbi:MAG: LysR family transcriptional regulator [Rhodobacteraceae bacterium]|nr:LysR family transcriptional regulator [Paracoccaceae bacterium]
MQKNDNWDDLRFVLAVADAGSVNAAAQALQVNHATVLRRIAAFEDRHAIRVFERDARGYRPGTGTGRLFEAARAVEAAMQSLERLASGQDSRLAGQVRLTSTDTFSHAMLPDILAAFHRQHPEIRVELQTTNAHLSLSRLDADLTVRPARELPEDLVGSIAAELGFGIYGRRDIVADQREAAHGTAQWLASGTLLERSPPGQWMAANIAPETVVGRADSFVTLALMARAGMGLALLPCCLGDDDPGLVRLNDGAPALVVDIWVAAHRDMAGVPRIKALRDYLVAALGARRRSLIGRY